MKYLFQLLVILAFAFAGELLHHFIHLPIPASIYGIALLFLALEIRVVKVKDVADVSSFFITIMPVLFLPPAVGIMESWGLISENWVAIVAVIVISTFVVMGFSGLVSQVVIRRRRKK